MTRPNPPKVFDITPEGYHEHNRYFNEAEKIFDEIESSVVAYLHGESKGILSDAIESTDLLWKIHDLLVGVKDDT